VDELRFDGRVAIVTGAGGRPGLGRAYAHLLAERGARVVVNDLGVGPDGRGVQRHSAELVAAEIVAAGGEAIADTHSVADATSAAAIVQGALDRWGRVDILVNNAGVVVLALFAEISEADIRRMVDVHLFGTIFMCKAAWPHMQQAGYGRIVNIATALRGQQYTVAYAAAKAGCFGLSRGLAVEGEPHGIKVNTVSPMGGTAAITHLNDPDQDWVRSVMTDMPPELVAPAVAYLAHESCPVTGRFLHCAGGETVERFFADTRGYASSRPTLEDVRDHFGEIVDRSRSTMLADPSASTGTAGFSPKTYTPAS